MKKQLKKRKKKSFDKKKMRDEFGALVAYLDDQFDLVVEGQQGLAKQIDNVDNKLEDHIKESDFKFKVLGSSLNDFRKEMLGFQKETQNFQKETRNNFKIVFDYLSRIDDEIQSIKVDVKGIKKELKRKVDLERVLKLEVRLAGVEEDLKRYKTKLS